LINSCKPLTYYNYGPLKTLGPKNAYNYIKRSYGRICFFFIINNNNHHPKNNKYYKYSFLYKREVVYPTINLK